MPEIPTLLQFFQRWSYVPQPRVTMNNSWVKILLSRYLWMDPVQNDLNQLGVKPSDPADYNIHIPPLPREGRINRVHSDETFIIG